MNNESNEREFYQGDVKPADEMMCAWPGCNSKAKASWDLDVENEQNAKVNMQFCVYHNCIVMGGKFNAKKTVTMAADENNVMMQRTDFDIEGPFREIELIEQVMAAREMTRKQPKSI